MEVLETSANYAFLNGINELTSRSKFHREQVLMFFRLKLEEEQKLDISWDVKE